MDLMNIFRFDDEGRLVEEYVRTDYRSFFSSSAPRVPDPRWIDEICTATRQRRKRPHMPP
jgi:hypothetical protein